MKLMLFYLIETQEIKFNELIEDVMELNINKSKGHSPSFFKFCKCLDFCLLLLLGL